MPNVGGKKYPYTEKGKMEAKKAAIKMVTSKSKKKSFSGANSQMGPSY